MDISEYRKQYAEQIKRAAEERSDYRDFLDKSKPASERRMALDAAPALRSRDVISESVNVIRDKDEDVQLRVSALNAMSIEISKSHELIDMVIGLLRDDTEPVALRMAALRVLQQSSFRTAIFDPKRPEYLAALRSIIDDKDPELRLQAMEILAKEKDEYVQRRLIEGLEDPSKALIRPEKAIQLLGYDIHSRHYPMLRQILQRSPNRAAKKEAVRLLAADASSKDLLAEIFRDKGENPEVRNISGIALQSLAPAEFEDQAKEIVLDDDEDDQLRASCVNALAHFADPDSLRQDSEFTTRVEQLGKRSTSKELKQATVGYMAKQQE